jgi:hypothetical protein
MIKLTLKYELKNRGQRKNPIKSVPRLREKTQFVRVRICVHKFISLLGIPSTDPPVPPITKRSRQKVINADLSIIRFAGSREYAYARTTTARKLPAGARENSLAAHRD